MLGPAGDTRHLRVEHWLEAPPFHPLRDERFPRDFRHLFWRFVTRVRRTAGDPFLKVRNRFRAELGPFLGHLQLRLFMADGLDEQALRRLAGHDYRAAIAALFPPVAIVEAQTALLLFQTVALHAFAHQNGTDTPFKKLRIRRRQCAERQGGENDRQE